ncbi:MAG: DUF998 domain-containing protein [Saprospiraceae bacterium]
MEQLRANYPAISVMLFLMLIIVAHVCSSGTYSWKINTISDLGAQGYDRKIIMQIGFLVFGLTLSAGIFLNGFSWRTAPILIYGLSVALTGVFCTKPIISGVSYAVVQSTLHATFAQIAGLAFSVGILMQIFFTDNKDLKFIHATFFMLIILLSATFGLLKNYQGIVQRLLYLTSFYWLIKYYKP